MQVHHQQGLSITPPHCHPATQCHGDTKQKAARGCARFITKRSQKLGSTTTSPDLLSAERLVTADADVHTRQYDCDVLLLIPINLYKAVIYCNGHVVQEMYDFTVFELRRRLRRKLVELDAASCAPLTKGVSGSLNKVCSIVRLRLFRYKQFKRKTLFLIAQNRNLDPKRCSQDPIGRIPCSEISLKSGQIL